MIFRSLLIALVFSLAATAVHAQENPAQQDPFRHDPLNQDPFGNDLEQEDTATNKRTGRILSGQPEPESPYGPTTTRFFYEDSFFRGDSTYYVIDTTLNNLHQFEIVEQLNNKYQTLGANGTALNPIFPVAPSIMGRTPGFDAYNLYFLDTDSMVYYDTRSPYTKMHLVFGGNNRNIVDIVHSRNVNERWNVTAFIYRIITDKQLGASTTRDDRNAVSNRYGFNTAYRSDDGRYSLLGSFVRMKHDVEELGGIVPPTTGLVEDYYDTNNVSVLLDQAESSELRVKYHLYHQYVLTPLIQAYHKLDRTNQLNYYRDPLSPGDIDFYGEAIIRSDTTTERFKFREFSNEIGIKGKVEESLFYAFYYKRRDVNFIYRYLQEDPFDTEHYIGGKLRTDLNERTYLSAEAEYLEGGNYRAATKIYSPWAVVGLKRTLRKPAFIEERYFGNHHSWDQDLSTESTDQLEGNIIVRLGDRLTIKPGATVTQITDPIYYNLQREATQADGTARIYSPELELNVRLFNNIFLDTEIIHTFKEGEVEDVFRIPEWFGNARVYYHGDLFNGRMEARIGFDMNYRSAYLADGYAPSIQQYYIQNDFRVPDAFVADFFFDFKIKRAMLFVKVTQANQGLPYDGYFTTPGYTGVGRQIDLGINWQFYD